MLIENIEPYFIPVGDDYHADVKVALGLLMESNCIWDSPLIRGTAVIEWNNSSTASPMPTLSDMGIGPWGGINGVFLDCWQLWMAIRMAVECALMVAMALPPMTSRFAWQINMRYASSNPSAGRCPSRLIIQQSSQWKLIKACTPYCAHGNNLYGQWRTYICIGWIYWTDEFIYMNLYMWIHLLDEFMWNLFRFLIS